ncbi:30S ribosome-binding factor RbfA [bacterium]|nr:30S ribosome-binding factor RbfA [bacterium]
MQSYNRSDRVAHQIQREVSELLLRKVKDPRVQFVTITRVLTSPDLRQARVFFSTPRMSEDMDKDVLEGLESAAGFIRSSLGKRLSMRRVPEIEFKLDVQYEQALKVSDTIAMIEREKQEKRERESKEENALERAVAAVRNCRRIGVVSHVDPDGDSTGCIIASLLLLKALDKEVILLQEQAIPKMYEFLPGFSLLKTELPSSAFSEQDDLDCTLVLDCPSLERASWSRGDSYKSAGTLINIDHHKDNSYFGRINLVDGSASSAAEILYGIIDAMDLGDDASIGANIYTAMFTDTGSFSYSNTTPESLRIAARLVEAGVDVSYLARNLRSDFTMKRLAFLGRVLSTVQSNEDNSIVWLLGTEAMRRETGFWGSTEQFANHAMRIREAQVGMLFLEEESGKYKVSIRSRGLIDAGQLAAGYGGGGHAKAAGCRINGSFDEVLSGMVRTIELGLEEAAGSNGPVLADRS